MSDFNTASEAVSKFLKSQETEIDWETYIPHSMPELILEMYLKQPVDKRQLFFIKWLDAQ